MMMPDSYEIRDNGVLVIIVNEVEYEFAEKEDFIYSDKKKIILKHHAVINLANNANINVGPPILLSSHDSGSFVFAREAVRSDGVKLSAVLILDAGFHTTDTFHCIQGTREGLALTWESHSMQEVYQRTCEDILNASSNRADISVYSLEKAFETGVVNYGATKEPYNFTKDFYRNLKAVCVELLDELTATYNGMLNVDVILLTGGTGAAWEKYIRDYYKDTKALEIILAGDGKDAFRANVMGYYNMLVSRCR